MKTIEVMRWEDDGGYIPPEIDESKEPGESEGVAVIILPKQPLNVEPARVIPV